MAVDRAGRKRKRLPGAPPWRVFLSHTAELRDAPAGRSFVAAAEAAVIRAGHAVSDMAYFAARDHEPADYCERMVANADVYVGIIGVRYGSPVRGRPDRSYTEVEYEAATGHRLPRLLFMVREDSTSLPEVDQPADHTARQQAFRRRLLDDAGVTVASITTPADMEINLYQALVELKDEAPKPRYPPNNLPDLRGQRFTQEELADLCDVSLSTYRGWEGREHLPRPQNIRALCKALEVDEKALGFGPAIAQAGLPELVPPDVDQELPPAVRRSQERWHEVRQLMTDRRTLNVSAAKLYDRALFVGESSGMARPEWIMPSPIDVRQLDLSLSVVPRSHLIAGTEPEARLVLPLHSPGHQYDRYTSAIRQLARPRLFENRLSFRLDSYSPERRGNGRPFFEFGIGMYFEKVDIGETLVHEFAGAVLDRQRQGVRSDPEWDDLPYRALIGDPFDLSQRPVLPGVHTLTLRRDGDGASMLLHMRDPARVATGGRIYTMIPSGEFQPSSIVPTSHEDDLDLWRNMVREYSEELLDMPEHDGSHGTVLDYNAWPLYRLLTSAQRSGKLRVYFLGMACNPLSLNIDLLTVAVFDADTYDSAFRGVRRSNSEGRILTTRPGSSTPRMAFDQDTVHDLLVHQRLTPPSAACLALAWQHHDAILSQR